MAAPNASHHVAARPAGQRKSPWLRLRVFLTRAGVAEALRAEQLRRPAARRRLAKSLRNALDSAQVPSRGLSAAPMLNRRGIEANRTWIRDLADALEQRPTVHARGVAMTAVLLHDGGGPLYNGTEAGAIRDAVVDALRELG
jgi:hypothetical protein